MISPTAAVDTTVPPNAKAQMAPMFRKNLRKQCKVAVLLVKQATRITTQRHAGGQMPHVIRAVDK